MVSLMEIIFEKFSFVNITPGFAKLYYKNLSNKLYCVKYARILVSPGYRDSVFKSRNADQYFGIFYAAFD